MIDCADIELLILDVDGVLTDGGLYYGPDGETLKRFHVQDGLAIKLLQSHGVDVAILSGRNSEMVSRRATELGIQHIRQGVGRKTDALAELATATGITPNLMACAGDDLPDLALFSRVGWSYAPANALAEVRARADFVTRRAGGAGAVADVARHLLTARGLWPKIVADFTNDAAP